MVRLVQLELFKMFTRKRSYIPFAAVLVIVILIAAALLYEGMDIHRFITRNISEMFIMKGNLVNGYLLTYLVLNLLWVHIPLLIVIVTGDLYSGEAHGGTFRLILTRPVTRSGLTTAKFTAALIYTFMLMLFTAGFSLLTGLPLLGSGDLMVLVGKMNIFSEPDVPWRFAAAFGTGFLSMLTVTCLSLLFSSMSSNSLGPILSTMAVVIVFTMISSFESGIFRLIRPYLFTTYMDSWQLFFKYPVPVSRILSNSGILAAHSVAFYFITLCYFNRKDINT
ncbi:MAG: ABC transporter permease [Bacteroidales bacterium]|nr:ABC transporter permease [Bacteroidales bacterium]